MAIVAGGPARKGSRVSRSNGDSSRRVDELPTDRAVRFIEGSKGGKQPFSLHFAMRGAHNDSYPHPGCAGKSLAEHPCKGDRRSTI
jgi:hypothetical protein